MKSLQRGPAGRGNRKSQDAMKRAAESMVATIEGIAAEYCLSDHWVAQRILDAGNYMYGFFNVKSDLLRVESEARNEKSH